MKNKVRYNYVPTASRKISVPCKDPKNMRNLKIHEAVIKDIWEPGYYGIICQIKEIQDMEKEQAKLIVTDGTINPIIANGVNSCVQISLKNVDKNFRDLYEGQVVKLCCVNVSGTFHFSVNCNNCPLQSLSLLEMGRLKLKIRRSTGDYEIPKHYKYTNKSLKEPCHDPLFLSLHPCDEDCKFIHYLPDNSDLGKQELKTGRRLPPQRSLTNPVHSTYTKLNEIEGENMVINVYGYVVKIKRYKKILPKHIVSTVHIVDDTLQFGQVVVVHLFSSHDEKTVPPKIQKVIRIHDFVASKTVKESGVSFHGGVRSADKITFFSVNDSGFVNYETSAQRITITDDDENIVRNIWNIMKEQDTKLSYVHLPGFYTFKCEVCAVIFNSEKSSLQMRGETLLSRKIDVEIINITPSFNSLKVGDFVTLSRIMALWNSQAYTLNFKVDCKACEVRHIKRAKQ